MAPNISVPMNFGIRLLDSPTHSTLELKASQGNVVKASSVILSFNSPVIDHMTTTLHLTSLDMEEFSEEAVRYFVDAAYSGESPQIFRYLFRDINKMANVFEMSWLVTRCVEQFIDISDAIQEPAYPDLVFLFDEAAYVLSKLKSRQLVEIALSRIRSLNGQQDFISRYLENLTSLSRQQLDLIIELAGTNVEHVVKPLTEQLTTGLSGQGTLVLTNYKYTLENIDLCYCQKYDTELYEGLFDMLEELCSTRDDFKWLLRLQRKSSKESVTSTESVTTTATTSGVVQCPDITNVLPTLFHTLDCSLTFDEVVDWLGKSDEVANLWMFVEGIWTWMRANENFKVECPSEFLDKVREIKTRRKWERISEDCLDFLRYGRELNGFTSCDALCARELELTRWGGAYTDLKDITSLFEQETKLSFLCWDYCNFVSNCSQPGNCGFIIKTVPAKDGANLVLSTDPNDYSDDIHYHDEVKAKDLHLILERDSGETDTIPLSWINRPVYQNNTLIWDSFPVPEHGKDEMYSLYLVFEYNPATSHVS